MEKYLTLEEFEVIGEAKINEAKIDKDFDKLQKIIDGLKDTAKLTGEFERWGQEMSYMSKKIGEIQVLQILKGAGGNQIWQVMPGDKAEEDFSAKELQKIAEYIINEIKNKE